MLRLVFGIPYSGRITVPNYSSHEAIWAIICSRSIAVRYMETTYSIFVIWIVEEMETMHIEKTQVVDGGGGGEEMV